MLVLARKSRESIVVGAVDNLHELLRFTVIEVRNGTVKLGFKANNDVAIYREEVWDRLLKEHQSAKVKAAVPPTVYRVPYID